MQYLPLLALLTTSLLTSAIPTPSALALASPSPIPGLASLAKLGAKAGKKAGKEAGKSGGGGGGEKMSAKCEKAIKEESACIKRTRLQAMSRAGGLLIQICQTQKEIACKDG